MCLLSFYPGGIIPDLRALENGAVHNSDGHGFAIATPGGDLISERYLDAAEAIERFGKMRSRHPAGPALFHSRFGTGGLTNKANCHPYRAGGIKRTVVGHNGVLFSVPKGDTRSDTRIFAENIFPRKFADLDSTMNRFKLEHYLGKYNKIAVITTNPAYKEQGYLFNERAGVWLATGEWHSNYDFEEPWEYRIGQFEKAEDEDYYWDCDVCMVAQAVDSVSGYCLNCGSCSDCGLTEENGCMCLVPRHIRAEMPEPANPVPAAKPVTWEEYLRERPAGWRDSDPDTSELCTDCGSDAAECTCAQDEADAYQARFGDPDAPAGRDPSSPSIAPPWNREIGTGAGANRVASLSENIVAAVVATRALTARRASSVNPGAVVTSAAWHEPAEHGADGMYVTGHVPAQGWASMCLRCAARWPHPAASAAIHPETECPGCDRCLKADADGRSVIHVIPPHMEGDSDLCPKCIQVAAALSELDRGDRPVMRAIDR